MFQKLPQKCDQLLCVFVSCLSYVSFAICIIYNNCMRVKSGPKIVTNCCVSPMSIIRLMCNTYHRQQLQVCQKLPQKCDQLLCLCVPCLSYHVPYVSYIPIACGPKFAPSASVVATVVRTPRSEVSERHRAGSWVWVVAKSRLDIW